MNSCLYECHVMHARLAPRRHAFAYRLFLFAIDLDELEALGRKLLFFSVNRRNLYSFRDRDYLPTSDQNTAAISGTATTPTTLTLKERVVAFLATRGIDLAGGRVLLVTLPRVAGYGFNPVSFYFCYDGSGTPVAALAEVTNTFREVKPYLLTSASLAGNGIGQLKFNLRTPKHFYVSPYSDVDVAFDFNLRVPDEKLSVQIDDYIGRERTLISTLRGTRAELTGARLAWFTLKYPLITLRIIALIHWHALLLWWKRVPWFAKAARAAEQRDLYRPHRSLQPSDAA